MTRLCPSCMAVREVTVEERQETYPVHGRPVTIAARVVVCKSCGETIFDPVLDEENLRTAYKLANPERR